MYPDEDYAEYMVGRGEFEEKLAEQFEDMGCGIFVANGGVR